MIAGNKCLVGVVVHTCEHGEQHVEHYVFFSEDETLAKDTLSAMVEAKAESEKSGFVAAQLYPGTMFLPQATRQ